MSADLLEVFPGSRWVEEPADERAARVVRWCRFLWADRKGVAAMATGLPYRKVNPGTGEIRYAHDDFTHHFFSWPSDTDRIGTTVVKSNAAGLDVYMAPMLRTSRHRVKVNGAGGRVAWADLDGELTEQRRTLIRRLGDAARLVSSGTGHHLYVTLDDWKTPPEVEAINRALRDVLDGDAKWSNESLLRPPGSYSLKPLVMFQRTPALVQGVTL